MDINILTDKLGHEFNKQALIQRALTHRSASKEHYERLEFLGDSILNFVIADALYKKYPKAKEGELSRMRANLVNGGVLAEIAKELSLGDYIKLGSGELKTGGSERNSILADALEALIGAIYLDSDMEEARKSVLRCFARRLDCVKLNSIVKDPKTLLQEYAQSQKIALPIYEIEQVDGKAHEQEFIVSCTMEPLSLRTEGQGTSRQRAEQNSAKLMLEKI